MKGILPTTDECRKSETRVRSSRGKRGGLSEGRRGSCSYEKDTRAYLMAVGGVLIPVYMCVIISMNSSCFMKLCWPNLVEDHGSSYSRQFDGRFIFERCVFETKSLGKMTMWGILSQGLFSSENRAASRRRKQMTRHNCNINIYLITMIILLSGNISWNPGPNQNPRSVNDLQGLKSTRGIKILHQNICGLRADKANLDELQRRQGCKHAHIIGISETHLNQRKDHPNGKGGGGIVVYVTETLTSQRRFDLEAVGIECIWIEVLFKNSKSLLVGHVYRPPDTSDYLPVAFNEKFETMLE